MNEMNEKSKGNIIFRVFLLTFAACYIYALTAGIRNNYGIMLNGIVKNSGIDFTSVSFVLAVGQLVFGAVQPAFGVLAAKKGNVYSLISGVILIVAGLFLTPQCKSIFSLLICLGVILPAGTGAIAFGVIMGSLAPKIPSKSFAAVSGIVNASTGIGNTVMSPLINSLIQTRGLSYGLTTLSIPALLMLPASILVGKRPKNDDSKASDGSAQPEAKKVTAGELFKEAFKSREYLILLTGFFTCGFHMALITNHLPTQFISYGFSAEAAAGAFSAYGIATMIGALLSGSFCSRLKMKNVLGFLYGLRPISVLLFFFVPKTLLTITAYVALLGLSGASTVSPVSGLVKKFFGAKSLAALFGFVFFVHQIGSFFSAWFGGICFNATGSYNIIWIVAIVLSSIASCISFTINE